MNFAKLLVITGSLLSALAADALADGVADFANTSFTASDLIKVLLPCQKRGTCCPTGKCRIVVMKTVPEPTGANLDITFELNSDVLSRESKEVLAKLGEALASPQLLDADYLIEGHTDATGSLPYNMELSKRRAESVRRHLVRTYRIDPDRLHTEGRGPTALVDPANPASRRNRRVVVRPDEYVRNDALALAAPHRTESVEKRVSRELPAPEAASKRQVEQVDSNSPTPRYGNGVNDGRR